MPEPAATAPPTSPGTSAAGRASSAAPTSSGEAARTLADVVAALAAGGPRAGWAVLAAGAAHLPGVVDAAVLVATHRGLEIVACAGDLARTVCSLEAAGRPGPVGDCLAGAAVVCADLPGDAARWPHYVPVALAAGLRSVVAAPLRTPDRAALCLLRSAPADGAAVVTALVDGASAAAALAESARAAAGLADQLQRALDSRVVVEQAKGVLAERWGCDPAVAFEVLRGTARSHNLRLLDVATAVVARRGPAELLRTGNASRTPAPPYPS